MAQSSSPWAVAAMTAAVSASLVAALIWAGLTHSFSQLWQRDDRPIDATKAPTSEWAGLSARWDGGVALESEGWAGVDASGNATAIFSLD